MKTKYLIFTLAAGLFLGSCGGSTEKEKASDDTGNTEEVIKTQETVELTIEANDSMRYDLETMSVPVGSRVKLTLKNVGMMPKEAMGHNWTLLEADTDVDAYAMDAIKAVDNDYQPRERYAEVVVYTKVLGPGESETIEFDAPDLGTYKFICTFPGHYKFMQGDFIVE